MTNQVGIVETKAIYHNSAMVAVYVRSEDRWIPIDHAYSVEVTFGSLRLLKYGSVLVTFSSGELARALDPNSESHRKDVR